MKGSTRWLLICLKTSFSLRSMSNMLDRAGTWPPCENDVEAEVDDDGALGALDDALGKPCGEVDVISEAVVRCFVCARVLDSLSTSLRMRHTCRVSARCYSGHHDSHS